MLMWQRQQVTLHDPPPLDSPRDDVEKTHPFRAGDEVGNIYLYLCKW